MLYVCSVSSLVAEAGGGCQLKKPVSAQEPKGAKTGGGQIKFPAIFVGIQRPQYHRSEGRAAATLASNYSYHNSAAPRGREGWGTKLNCHLLLQVNCSSKKAKVEGVPTSMASE